MLIPSHDLPDARSALAASISPGCRISAAVAFVTQSGVRLLGELLEGAPGATLEMTARAEGVTDPVALQALRDELGAEVWVVIGRDARAFHPKLWLIESTDGMRVLSGSGNLTEAGMTSNQEQFELLAHSPDSPEIKAEYSRLQRLAGHGVLLDERLQQGYVWREFVRVYGAQQRLRRDFDNVRRHLDAADPGADQQLAKQQLLKAVKQRYEDIVAAHMPTETGMDYVPRRLAQAIARADRGELEVVKLIAGHLQGSGIGAKRLLDANRPELTLEHLVLDETTPGRELLSGKLLERAAATLAAAGMLPEAIATTAARPGQPMTATEVGRHLDGLLDANGRQPLALPLVHDAQAFLLRIGEGKAHCRRASGSTGSVGLRLLAARREQLRTDSTYRPLQSDLREGSERTTALIGPLLLSLPDVHLADDGRFLFA